MTVGLDGLGVTVRVIALVFIITGETHFAFDDSVQLIMSPLTGVEIVMEVCPLVPGMVTPFLNQFITGADPGLVVVSVKTAASPEHKEFFGVEMEAECVIFGETITVMEFELAMEGVAQDKLVVSLHVITSLLFNPVKVILVCPLVPEICTPFLNQVILGVVPPLPDVKLKVAD